MRPYCNDKTDKYLIDSNAVSIMPETNYTDRD